MYKSVFDITVSVKHQKQVLTTSDVINIEGIFVVKLRDLNVKKYFLYTITYE